MKRNNSKKWFVLVLAMIMFFPAAVFGQNNAQPVLSKRFKVAATIFPLADIVKNIGGEQLKVITILPPGANPHMFELTPSKVRELSGSRAVFSISRIFDNWAKMIPEISGVELFPVAEMSPFLGLDLADPHLWLSIQDAIKIAQGIASDLSHLDPAHASDYQANYDLFVKKLKATDRDIKNLLSGLPTRKIVTFHNGWRYFAAGYQLDVVGTVEFADGKEPTPQHLAKLADQIKSDRIHVLFVEPWVETGAEAKAFAEDMKLKMIVLDPIGGAKGRESYIEMMRFNARQIQEALQHE